MKVLNYFNKAYYINLNKRTDRKESFEKRIKELGIQVERFSAIEVDPIPNHSDPFRHFKEGCINSHIEIVRKAKNEGLDSILIFEDDCIFEDNFIEYATKAANELYNESWDLFYFGGESNGECPRYKNHLRRVTNGMYQTHAYAINKSYYDTVLNINPQTAANIDIFYIHDTKAKVLMSDKLLCFQEDGFSDNYGHEVKYNRSNYYKYGLS